jgi:hypothetical protein
MAGRPPKLDLPDAWAAPSRFSQRVAAEMTALGLAWRNAPLPIRMVGLGLAVGTIERLDVVRALVHQLPLV